MDFFASQDRSYRNTRVLIILMTLAVGAVVVCVTSVLAATLWLSGVSTVSLSFGAWLPANLGVLLYVAAAITVFIGLASVYRVMSLRQGGGRVARDLGGTPVGADEQDPLRRRLRNVIEEMAIASGVPVPEIYVLDHEAGINAFAAGFQPADAAVAVTRGALETLDRDELQAVVAHEFSHILNGDMRLNIRLMGPLFGILVIGLLGRMLLRSSRSTGGRRNKGVGAVIVLGIGLSVVGYVGLLLGRVIKAGVSRQREYLADASAVQFTRQTRGMAGALKKIAGLAEGSTLADNEAEEVSHMLFANGLTQNFGRALASHPPLFDRIRAIDPAFTAKQFAELHTERLAAEQIADDSSPVSGLAGTQPATASVDGLTASIANPSEAHLAAARALLTGLPPLLTDTLDSPNQVLLLPLAMLLHPDDAQRRGQLGLVERQLGRQRTATVAELADAIRGFSHEVRLPLLDLALPSIKQQPVARIEHLGTLMEQLANFDNRLERYEYALLRIYGGYMRAAAAPAAGSRWRNISEHKMLAAGSQLVCVFAQQANEDAAGLSAAAKTGLRTLGVELRSAPPVSDWVRTADRALEVLQDCTPSGRKQIVRALIATAMHDGRLSQPESELLRAWCMMLECPLPPLLNTH